MVQVDGSTCEIDILDWINNSKMRLKKFKAKLEAKEKVKVDSQKFEKEHKLRLLPKLAITPLISPQDWLAWVGSVTTIAKTFSPEDVASPQFLCLTKASIAIEEDKK